MTISQATFDRLAFPVARVRYSGPTDRRGARWYASIRRDNERTFRTSTSYDDALPTGAANALPAALKCLGLALDAIDSTTTVADYIAIPGDLDASTYSFTFVPLDLLTRRDAIPLDELGAAIGVDEVDAEGILRASAADQLANVYELLGRYGVVIA